VNVIAEDPMVKVDPGAYVFATLFTVSSQPRKLLPALVGATGSVKLDPYILFSVDVLLEFAGS
jgi:hypothetical protein